MKTYKVYVVMLFVLLFPISSLAGSCPFGTMEKGWCWPTEGGGWGNFLDWHGVNPYYAGIHLGKDIAPGSNAVTGSNKTGRRVVALADGVVSAVKDDACGYGGITAVNDGTTCKYKRGAGIVVRHTATSGQEVYVLYAHLDPLTARWHAGNPVTQGQDMGTLNDYTGGAIHLHLGASLATSSNPWPGYGDTDGIFINPVTFLQSNNPQPGFVIRSAKVSNGVIYWRTKNLTDLSCENAQAWLIEDHDKAMSYETNASVCPKSCNSSSVMNDGFKWLDFFIKPTYAGLNDCATTVSNIPTGGSSAPESSGSMPMTGGTNSGTLANLIPNNSDIENAAKVKVLTLHINESGFCKMQTKNVGKKDATAFQSQCYISDGAKIDKYPRDEGKEDTRSLAKGATNTEHEDFTAPEFPGLYNAVWCTDSAGASPGQVKESNEGDNCHAEDSFTVWSSPNVLATSVTMVGGKTVLLPGESYSVDTTITNNGENFGTSIQVGWYLTGPGTGGARVLIDTDNIQRENLKGGVSKVENLNARFAPETGGVYTLESCPDYDNRIAETNEGDNCTSMNFEVYVAPVTPPPPPAPVLTQNLSAVAVDFGSEQVIEVNEVFTPGFTVKNNGTVGSTLITIAYYLDGTLKGTDQIQPVNLPTGDTKRETLESFSVSTIGQHTLKACVDYTNGIPETDEGDNCAEKVFQVVSIVYKPVDAPLVTSCPQMPEPDFNTVPTIPSGDVGASVFGNTKHKIFIPIATLPQARISLVWGGFANFDPALVTKWCWNSDETYWGANYSKSCGTTFATQGNNWVIEIPNTPQASKGTWSFIQSGTEYWVKPDTITALPLDTDGHIRYNNWTPNTVTVGDDPSGMMVTASFSNKNVAGFWLPINSVLNGKAYWFNDQDPYPGAPGRLECDANTGKLKATIPNVAPSSTGRVILGLTDATQFVWQITPQWVLPIGATVTNVDGDYKLPASASTFQKREVLYDKGQQKLTITISGDDRMLTSFFSVTKLDQVTTEAYFDAWIVPTGQAVKLIKGDVARSVMGVWTLIFVGLPPDFGGSVYLPLTSGAKAWQDVSKFAFGSAIVVDVTAGNYVMPK